MNTVPFPILRTTIESELETESDQTSTKDWLFTKANSEEYHYCPNCAPRYMRDTLLAFPNQSCDADAAYDDNE